MITEETILKCLDEVDKDKVVDYLVDSNEVGFLLHAIANESSDIHIDSIVSVLKAMADAKRYNLAADLAIQQELNNKVGEMK